MSISKNQVVDILRLRYDAHSAEAIFQIACARAGLEDKTELEPRELVTFRSALERVGDRVGNVLARLDDMLADPAPASTPSPKPASTSDAKVEVKADVKPEAAKPKADAKADGKRVLESDAKVVEPAATRGETTIVLRGLEVDGDDEVLVCGASADLGDWDPAKAHPMVRDGDAWKATVMLAPDAEVAFKFLRRTTGGEITWEEGGNRFVVGGGERLDASWR